MSLPRRSRRIAPSARPPRTPAAGRRAWLAVLAAALALLFAAPAGAAMSLVPPKPDVLLGVSDRGSTEEFNPFAELTGKHPALMETFLGWGNSVNKAYERWRETQTRPVVAISTQNAQTLEEIITPEQIALGAGDDYLLQLNNFFATHNLPAYIRPLGEPNRCLNAWAGVECDGTLKGGEHSAFWYKDGLPADRRDRPRRPDRWKGSNADARRTRPAAAEPEQGRRPRSRCRSPRSASSGARSPPARRGSKATSRATTGRGANGSTGSAPTSTPNIRSGKTSTASTKASSGRTSRSRSPSGRCRKTTNRKFVKQLISWVVRHKRVQMLNYYQGFGPGNTYELGLYPQHRRHATAQKIRRANFLAYAEYNAGLLPPLPPKEKKP